MGSRTKDSGLDGLLLVDKPAGCTSNAAVGQCRRAMGQRRAGHAGTLDPDATGLLLVGFGKVTRLLSFMTAMGKEYVGEVVFGVETDTLDAAGSVVARHEMSGVGREGVQRAANSLTGEIMQVPPMVSALHHEGRRLHELAREGIEVVRQPRPVTVTRFEIGEAIEPLVFPFRVTCSSGTYVRVLAADVGRILGGGAHLRGLRRTRVGPFEVDEACPLASVSDEVRTTRAWRKPSAALPGYGEVIVSAETAEWVRQGRVLSQEHFAGAASGPWLVVDGAAGLLAVYERHGDGLAKPIVVLARD